jgi:hypothetical protein
MRASTCDPCQNLQTEVANCEMNVQNVFGEGRAAVCCSWRARWPEVSCEWRDDEMDVMSATTHLHEVSSFGRTRGTSRGGGCQHKH